MCALSEYPPGTYNQAVSVDMRCSTSGAFIFYTVDESEPTVHSNLYQGEPIRISNHVSVNDDPDPADEYLPLTTTSLTLKALAMNAFGGWDEATLHAASPSTYLNHSQPPFHLVYAWDDMAGCNQEALDFFALVQALNGPFVDVLLLEESDIPPEVVDIDFDGDFDGHWEEIHAINTRSWDCLSVTTVVDFVESH